MVIMEVKKLLTEKWTTTRRKNVITVLLILLLLAFLKHIETNFANIALSSNSFPSNNSMSASTSVRYNPANRAIHILVLEANDKTQDAIELCSIYSIAKTNPSRPVYIHTRHDLPESHLWTSTLENVKIIKINDATICDATPAAAFYQKFLTQHLKTSVHAIAELSDLLRSCIIYKQGGTYIDSDIIMLKPFPENYRNFLPDEQGAVMCSVIDFDAGNLKLNEVLTSLESNYQPGKWGSIGPEVYKKVFNHNMTSVTIIPGHIFYPIGWGEVLNLLIKENSKKEAFDRIYQHNDTIGIHVYRAMFAFYNQNQYSSNSALGTLMKEHCLPIFAAKIEGHFMYHNYIKQNG